MMLVVAMSMAMLIGCTDDVEDVGNADATDIVNSEIESEVASEEVLENVSAEMTIEEKIAAEMPAKLEVGEDEIIVPETVTAEQIMAKWEEIKVSDVEYAEDINKENLAGLLVLNCSYMEPAEFDALVNEYFGSINELMHTFTNYTGYLCDSEGYGKGSSILPEKLFFDENLINQSEQITYLIERYQTDTENSKVYYDIIMNYLYRSENPYMTFDCSDERLSGSGLASLKFICIKSIWDDMAQYDLDIYMDTYANERENLANIVEECASQK